MTAAMRQPGLPFSKVADPVADHLPPLHYRVFGEIKRLSRFGQTAMPTARELGGRIKKPDGTSYSRGHILRILRDLRAWEVPHLGVPFVRSLRCGRLLLLVPFDDPDPPFSAPNRARASTQSAPNRARPCCQSAPTLPLKGSKTPEETTTTEVTVDSQTPFACLHVDGSSSSLASLPENPETQAEVIPIPDPAKVAELTVEAEVLFGVGVAGKVRAAVVEFGMALVAYALALVARRNRRPGNKRVESWGYVRSALAQMRREGFSPTRLAESIAARVRSLLERLRAEGWVIRPDGKGGVERVRVEKTAPAWERLPAALLTELTARRDEIRIHVLRAAGGTPCATPIRASPPERDGPSGSPPAGSAAIPSRPGSRRGSSRPST